MSDDDCAVTFDEYEGYELVRQSGAYNMITDARRAARVAGLTVDRYMAVLRNYSKAKAKYGLVA